ncbi:helix-turn-helix transcriptional regulator [Inquilinus sp. KBS0705]|nr:helix-turn-helix transcriptional regulator [Inquilinus sp. KBS0705]
MVKHYGQIVEYRIRKNGYSISDLAKSINVNRRSIYNWFNQPYLKKDIIFQIGRVLRHDFSQEFPELFVSEDFKTIHRSPHHMPAQDDTYAAKIENEVYKNKYVDLLERYNTLLVSAI